jgi:hypothetical protein
LFIVFIADMKIYLVCGLFALILLSGCEKPERSFLSGDGKRPVYVSEAELTDIRNELPGAVQQSGTIFLRDTLLFLLDKQRGVFVYSLADTLNSRVLTFFKIPAITDFIISGNILYADSWRDLVVIDISDLYGIRETNRIKDVVNPSLYPPDYFGIFECVDESKGAVVGWENAYLENVRCSTF